MPRGALWKVLFPIVRGAVKNKRFRSYEGPGFVVSRGVSLDHNTATLHYQEGAIHFNITAEEGVDGGFTLDVDEMGAQSLSYASLPVSEKLRIAGNIHEGLAAQSIPCQVVENCKPLDFDFDCRDGIPLGN